MLSTINTSIICYLSVAYKRLRKAQILKKKMQLLLGFLLTVQCEILLEKTDLVEINEQDPIVHEFKKSNIRFEYDENTFGQDKRRRIGAGSGFD